MRWKPNKIKRVNSEQLIDRTYARRLDQMYRKQLSDYPRGEYIYLLWDYADSNLYKIGRTQVPKNRIANLSSDYEFYILAIIPCKNSRLLEHALHFYFVTKHDNHEWYRLNAKNVAFIKEVELRVGFYE